MAMRKAGEEAAMCLPSCAVFSLTLSHVDGSAVSTKTDLMRPTSIPARDSHRGRRLFALFLWSTTGSVDNAPSQTSNHGDGFIFHRDEYYMMRGRSQ